jgi:hypothetical protein
LNSLDDRNVVPLLDSKNVSDERTFVAIITHVGPNGDLMDTEKATRTVVRDVFVDTHLTPGDDDDWDDFDVMELPISYRELSPNESDRDFTISLRLDETQREAIMGGSKPFMSAASQIGQFTLDLKKLDLPSPDNQDLEGEVVVLNRRRYEDRRGRTRYHFNVLAHLGDRLDWDRDKAEEIIESRRGAKRKVAF